MERGEEGLLAGWQPEIASGESETFLAETDSPLRQQVRVTAAAATPADADIQAWLNKDNGYSRGRTVGIFQIESSKELIFDRIT